LRRQRQMCIRDRNILCHRISESEVIPVVCDNIGESTLIPLATWSKWCCLRKQERLWKRFIAQPALAIACLLYTSDAAD
ncbi:hypothetical protein ELP57_40750, partial [Klebsiella pneumoniae]|nr:hypothetical protein [Klebsiella pneumoniae]